MTESLYDFFGGASGFTMIVIGLGYFSEPERPRIRLAIGSLFAAAGAAFMLSWSSRFGLLPLALDNLLIVSILLVASLSVFEIQIYVFGDESRHGRRRAVYRMALIWSGLLWLLPFFDFIFKLPALMVSIEDGRSAALFQAVTVSGMLVLPIAVGIVSLRIGRWKLADIPIGSRYVRSLFTMLVLLISLLVLISIAFVTDSIFFYRLGQGLLQVLILGWYLHIKAAPDVFILARRDIGREHKKKTQMDPDEVSAIKEKLLRLETEERIHTNVRLDEATLAVALGIPTYRLVLFMTVYRGSSFVEWLHAARIDQARTLLAETPDLGIDALGKAVGYSSPTKFRSQFLRRAGMTPEAFRTKNLALSARSKRKVPGKV